MENLLPFLQLEDLISVYMSTVKWRSGSISVLCLDWRGYETWEWDLSCFGDSFGVEQNLHSRFTPSPSAGEAHTGIFLQAGAVHALAVWEPLCTGHAVLGWMWAGAARGGKGEESSWPGLAGLSPSNLGGSAFCGCAWSWTGSLLNEFAILQCWKLAQRVQLVLKSENPDLGLLPLSGDCKAQPVLPAQVTIHTCFRQWDTGWDLELLVLWCYLVWVVWRNRSIRICLLQRKKPNLCGVLYIYGERSRRETLHFL